MSHQDGQGSALGRNLLAATVATGLTTAAFTVVQYLGTRVPARVGGLSLALAWAGLSGLFYFVNRVPNPGSQPMREIGVWIACVIAAGVVVAISIVLALAAYVNLGGAL